MGKTFENLTWDDMCDLMCGGPEDEPIRQDANVRVSERCMKQTRYNVNDGRSYVYKTCQYLENGKCTLTVCIRKGDK